MLRTPIRQTAVSFQSGGLELEGVCGLPEPAPGKIPAVVICHPHPLRGGSMDNVVVMAIYLALVRKGIGVLRFNFRGVGNSQGSHSAGEEEPNDVRAALDFLQRLPGIDKDRIGLAGYSFGSGMVLKGIGKYRECKALALISPPVRFYDEPHIARNRKPKLFITGTEDDIAPGSGMQSFVETLPQPAECRTVAGANHFWGGHLEDLASQVADFFAEHLV